MKRLAVVPAVILATLVLAPTSACNLDNHVDALPRAARLFEQAVVAAQAQSETGVTGGAGGVFPADATYNGIPLGGLTLGMGLTIASSGAADGDFQTMLVGLSPSGEQYIQVEGRATTGSAGAAYTAFSGECSVDMGDGTPPLSAVPFTVVVATNADGTPSFTLTLGETTLPAATVNSGGVTIE